MDDIRQADLRMLVGFVAGLGVDFWQRWEFPYGNMGASVADASLQAGVHYMSVVDPRVRAIRDKYPAVKTTSAFIDLADKASLAELLNWTHPEKLRRTREALTLFKSEGVETESDLFTWIEKPESKPKLMACRGVGPKTFDYYRMIARHRTVAVDRHLIAFLGLAGVETAGYDADHALFVQAASMLGRNAAELDYSVWKYMSERAPVKPCETIE